VSFAEESALACAHIRKLDEMAVIARRLAETIERQEFTPRWFGEIHLGVTSLHDLHFDVAARQALRDGADP